MTKRERAKLRKAGIIAKKQGQVKISLPADQAQVKSAEKLPEVSSARKLETISNKIEEVDEEEHIELTLTNAMLQLDPN